MGKYKSKYHWNFRVITGKDHFGNRFFSIVETYYNKDNVPDSYAKRELMSEHESVEDLKWERKKIKDAFKKPILDKDNFPKEWKEEKNGI